MTSRLPKHTRSPPHEVTKDLCTHITHRVKAEFRKKTHKCHCVQEWQPVSDGQVVEKSIPGIDNVHLLETFRNVLNSQQNIVSFLEQFHTVIPGHLSWLNNLHELRNQFKLDKNVPWHIKIYKDIHANRENDEMTDLEAAFQINKINLMHDKNLCMFIARQVMPECSVLDTEVANVILRTHKHDTKYTLENFKSDLKNWRSKELLYPLLVACTYMPNTIDWKMEADDEHFQKVLDTLGKSEHFTEICEAIKSLPYHPLLNSIIEHIGFLYHEKEIDTTKLQGSIGDILQNSIDFLESKEVPSFLLVPSVSMNTTISRPTWGIESIPLTLEAQTNKLYIPKARLRVFAQEELGLLTVSSRKYISGVNQQAFKLGELILSPVLSNCIINGGYFCTSLSNFYDSDFSLNTDERRVSSQKSVPPTRYSRSGYQDPVENLEKLRRLQHSDFESVNKIMTMLHVQYKQIATSRKLSSVSCHRPLVIPGTKLVGWTISLPKRAMALKNDIRDVENLSLANPHRLTRHFRAEKSNHKGVSGIHLVTGDTASQRKFVCAAINYKFRDGFKEMKEKDNSLHSVLHESVACFILHKPTLHNKVSLHNSIPWDQDYQDHRYAETQRGKDGQGRFRDWCSFVSNQQRASSSSSSERPKSVNITNAFKSKIESHVLNVDHRNTWMNSIPLIMSREEPVTHKWVCINSSLPFTEERVSDPSSLTLYQQDLHSTHHDLLLNSVKCKIKSFNTLDSHPLLPTRDSTHKLEKDDVHIHSDENTGTVLVVYSSKNDPDKNMDFVAFKLCK